MDKQCSIGGCERTVIVARGWCARHYQRWQKHGDPEHPVTDRNDIGTRGDLVTSLIEANRNPGTECVFVPYVGRYARVAWKLLKGDPGELVMRHTCDNSRCVNLNHVVLGTQADNMNDMIERGRHWHLKLTVADVHEIRRHLLLGHLQKDIGSDYGVSQMTISKIKLGVTWKHLNLPPL